MAGTFLNRLWGRPAVAAAGLAALAVLGIAVPAAGAAVKPKTVSSPPCGGYSMGPGWTCTFSDEFDGTSLNSGKWFIQQTPASGFTTGDAAHAACYTNDASNIGVAGGTLNLTVRKLARPVACGTIRTSYTAGEATTYGTFNQAYGRFEVRAKLPAMNRPGFQPAFWLWPQTMSYGPWPSSGEIDFAEFYSSLGAVNVPSTHYDATSRADWSTNSNVATQWPGAYAEPGTSCAFDQSQYNTFTLDWSPNLLAVYVNGAICLANHYAATQGGAAPFDKPFFLALLNGLGSGDNAVTNATTFPNTVSVDWVHVWQRAS